MTRICYKNTSNSLRKTFDVLFLRANSSSDCFLSGLRLGRSFFTLLGLLLRSCKKTEARQLCDISRGERVEEVPTTRRGRSSPPCSRGLQRVAEGGQAAGSSGSRVWGCWVVPMVPTSWCCEAFRGRRGEAGCGRWGPRSCPSPQNAGTGSEGETGAVEMNKKGLEHLRKKTTTKKLVLLYSTFSLECFIKTQSMNHHNVCSFQRGTRSWGAAPV